MSRFDDGEGRYGVRTGRVSPGARVLGPVADVEKAAMGMDPKHDAVHLGTTVRLSLPDRFRVLATGTLHHRHVVELGVADARGSHVSVSQVDVPSVRFTLTAWWRRFRGQPAEWSLKAGVDVEPKS